MTYLVEHEIRIPVRSRSGPQKGDLEWRRVNRASLLNLFANPIYAGIYAYGVRAVDKRRQKPGRRGTGRRPPRSGEAEVFLHDVCRPISASSAIGATRRNCNPTRPHGAERRGRDGPSFGCSRLRPLRPAHARPIQQQRSYGALRLPGDEEQLQRSFLSVAEGSTLDDLIASLVLEAVTPAAIEASVALAENLEAERAALDRHRSEAGARGIRGRTRAPAVCGRGAGKQAGGAYARTRLGGGSE